MINKPHGLLTGLALWILTLSVTGQAATWVPISGNVRLADGTPICAMVLANGQYMFSCDGSGYFGLNVPLDDQGQVTLFSFADGFAPYGVTAGPFDLPTVVSPDPATAGDPVIVPDPALECSINPPYWVHISGPVRSAEGEPLCAMVLSNGQHMFSCEAGLGQFDLTVPVDENGQVALLVFADGFQPYSETFNAPECGYRYATIDGVELEYRLEEETQPALGLVCGVELYAQNTTSTRKRPYLTFTAWDFAGVQFSPATVSFDLAPGGFHTSYVLLGNRYGETSGCSGVASWELTRAVVY